MKAAVLSVEGNKSGEIELPGVFSEELNRVLIKRAVLASQSSRVQPKGPNKSAGRNYTATYIGSRKKPQQYRTINVGHARLPRLKNRRHLLSGQVALVPQAVKGPRAHPPKPEKNNEEKINRQEKRKALRSAIAATSVKELVSARGHIVPKRFEFPLVGEKRFEGIDKTKKVVEVFEKIGLIEDVKKSKSSRKIRAGKGKKRGRKYKKTKSVLLVVENSKKIFMAARNIAGVDVVEARNLNTELLAPGTVPGRLTLWSESALKVLGEKKW